MNFRKEMYVQSTKRLIGLYEIMMNAYKCTVTYEGTKYNGWQKQGNTDNTIQGKIEALLSRILSEDIEIAASGRTDAGVHAIAQVFHFHCEKQIDTDTFLDDANRYLPKDIRIVSIEECDLRFHSRLNATQKTYKYQIDISKYGNPFIKNHSHHVGEALDIEAIKTGANYFLGTHDFKSFCSNKRMKKSTIRTIYNIQVSVDEANQLLTLIYTGNGFLYNMVRIMTGTLIEIGLGIRNANDIPSILKGCDRALAGHTAPPQGLFLVCVDYV